jgi:hypothetical protein
VNPALAADPALIADGQMCAQSRALVGNAPQARARTRTNAAKSRAPMLACHVLTPAARSTVLTTKGMLLAGSWAAVVLAVIAMSGFTSSGMSQILLASGAMIALVLTRSGRRD